MHTNSYSGPRLVKTLGLGWSKLQTESTLTYRRRFDVKFLTSNQHGNIYAVRRQNRSVETAENINRNQFSFVKAPIACKFIIAKLSIRKLEFSSVRAYEASSLKNFIFFQDLF